MAEEVRTAPDGVVGSTGALDLEQLGTVPLERIKLLDLNARFMRRETFARLIENMKLDGACTSAVLLCTRVWDEKAGAWLFEPNDDFDYIVPSGNHRTQAAIAAGLTHVPAIVVRSPVTRDRMVAMQIAHNAVEGEDDPAILKQLYDGIDDTNLRLFSGLDDEMLGLMEKVDVSTLGNATVSYRMVSLAFFPEEHEDIVAGLTDVKDLVGGQDLWVAALKQYEPFMTTLAQIKGLVGASNIVVALAVLIDMFRQHRDELLPMAFDEDGEARHAARFEVGALVGTDTLPAGAAAIVLRAMRRFADAEGIPESERWKWLEAAAADYLAGTGHS